MALQWVSVKDSLPQVDEWVIVFGVSPIYGMPYAIDQLATDPIEGLYWGHSGIAIDSELVTHWCAITQPNEE